MQVSARDELQHGEKPVPASWRNSGVPVRSGGSDFTVRRHVRRVALQ
jgi:hypothetical protein